MWPLSMNFPKFLCQLKLEDLWQSDQSLATLLMWPLLAWRNKGHITKVPGIRIPTYATPMLNHIQNFQIKIILIKVLDYPKESIHAQGKWMVQNICLSTANCLSTTNCVLTTNCKRKEKFWHILVPCGLKFKHSTGSECQWMTVLTGWFSPEMLCLKTRAKCKEQDLPVYA